MAYFSLPSFADAQARPMNFPKRGTPYNLKSLDLITVPNSRTPTQISNEDDEANKRILLRNPRVTGTPLSVESYYERYFRREPDKAYAEALIGEAKKSIVHLFQFLGSDLLRVPVFNFKIPQTANEVSLKAGSGLVYLVSDYGNSRTTLYKAKLDGKEEVAHLTRSFPLAGETIGHLRFVATEKGFDFEGYRSEPVFYRTSGTLIDLIETPPIEALHIAIEKYTHINLAKEVKESGRTWEALDTAKDKAQHREEVFIHALSVIWLKEYNKARGLGLTEAELERRFIQYENQLLYQGTNQMAKYIASLDKDIRKAIQKAIEMYAHQLGELFNRAGIK